MKNLVYIGNICIFVALLSACNGKVSEKEITLESSTRQSSTVITKESNSQKKKVGLSETSETENKQLDSTVTSIECPFEPPVELGTIYYQDLDINDPIQANAQYLGCYIVDDGTKVNYIPLMAATVQNLQIYTSGQGNEDYYQQFLDKAIETSNLTGGKLVNIFDREDGSVIITAENGEITFKK